MLHDFLGTERSAILAACSERFAHVSDFKGSSEELEIGLPVFYDELVEVLRSDGGTWDDSDDRYLDSIHRESAALRGKESLRLGFTISQVVQGYGALCQAITRHAARAGGEPITAREFNRLNSCLDVAIAEAVSEFNRGQKQKTTEEEVLRLGFLSHELRQALSASTTAFYLLKNGVVGSHGSTGQILENSLAQMRDIIDRCLSEVRLQGTPEILRHTCRVVDLVGEVESTSIQEANTRSVRFQLDVAPDLEVCVDRHLVLSALSNLIHNAIKFSRQGGLVSVVGRAHEDRIRLEIHDECGGLPPGKSEDLFRAFAQKGSDRTGIGLGLSIARRAVELNDGTVSVRDRPGHGCAFTIELPRATRLQENPPEPGPAVIEDMDWAGGRPAPATAPRAEPQAPL